MKKAVFLFSTLIIMISCSNHQISDRSDKPSFEIKKNIFEVTQPINISGIGRYNLDTIVIKKNHIKQYICYEEHSEIRFFAPSKIEWKMIETCTFDTTGNWVQYKLYDDYGIQRYSDNNEQSKPSDKTIKDANYSKSYWVKNEHFVKSDSMFYYARYNVKDGKGYLVYDSMNSTLKNLSQNYASIYHGDTVIHKENNKVTRKTIYLRNKSGQIEQKQEIDNRGLYETTTYEYINGFVSKSIKQDMVDMAATIFIDVIEYNDKSLPVNYKCYALENSKTAIEEYKSGHKKARKISEIKVEWIN